MPEISQVWRFVILACCKAFISYDEIFEGENVLFEVVWASFWGTIPMRGTPVWPKCPSAAAIWSPHTQNATYFLGRQWVYPNP